MQIDWPVVLDELKQRGWTQILLAERFGCGQPRISELRTGKAADPRYSLASAILDLHRSGALATETEPVKAA